MRTIVVFCALLLLGGGLLLWRQFRMPNVYGAFTDAPKVEVAELIAHPDDYLQKTILLEDIVRDQCEAMGCYFYFFAGTNSIKVDLADIAMHAPKKKDGHVARVEGRIMPDNSDYVFWASAVEFK